MKKSLWIGLVALVALGACKEKGCTDPTATNYSDEAQKDDGSCEYVQSVGEITVSLDANKSVIRVQEALIGNFACDAMYEYGTGTAGKTLDFAIANSGGLRFDSDTRADGIYPAGDWTSEMVNEMLPFGNTAMVVTLTGNELKEMFERSASALPAAEGLFLQVSSQLKVTIDTNMTAQVIDETNPDSVFISQSGSRVTSIKINGTEYDSASSYTFITSNFIGDGGDGYVTLENLDAAKKEDLGVNLTVAIEDYLKANSPLTPTIDGRIVIQ